MYYVKLKGVRFDDLYLYRAAILEKERKKLNLLRRSNFKKKNNKSKIA